MTTEAEAAPTGGQQEGTESQRLVLITVDQSEQAEKAFEYYVHNLHRAENKILCLHISETPVLPTTSVYMSAEILEGLIQEERKKAKDLEQKYAAKLKEHNLSGRIKTIFYGRAGEAIVEEASKEHAGMVVMGTRGLGALRRTILGSVSDYVLHHVHCPVVICRE